MVIIFIIALCVLCSNLKSPTELDQPFSCVLTQPEINEIRIRKLWSKVDASNCKQLSWFMLDSKFHSYYSLPKYQLAQMHLKIGGDVIYNMIEQYEYERFTQFVLVNNSVFKMNNHTISKWNSKQLKWNKFSDMYNGTDAIGLRNFAVAPDNENDCLLFFGGYDMDNMTRVDYILEFNITTKLWNKLPISLPKQMEDICCKCAMNNTHIILFGGEIHDIQRGNLYNHSSIFCDDIYIYSIKKRTITQSKIKCPIKSGFNGITISEDELLVYGYIRNVSTVNIPNCLLKLMGSYVCLNEFIYLQSVFGKEIYEVRTSDIV